MLAVLIITFFASILVTDQNEAQDIEKRAPPLQSLSEEKEDDDSSLTVMQTLAIGFGVTGGVLVIGVCVIKGLGFTSRGVSGSSWASGRQSQYGNVSSGSCFSSTQSASAKGCLTCVCVVGLLSVILAGIIFIAD